MARLLLEKNLLEKRFEKNLGQHIEQLMIIPLLYSEKIKKNREKDPIRDLFAFSICSAWES